MPKLATALNQTVCKVTLIVAKNNSMMGAYNTRKVPPNKFTPSMGIQGSATLTNIRGISLNLSWAAQEFALEGEKMTKSALQLLIQEIVHTLSSA